MSSLNGRERSIEIVLHPNKSTIRKEREEEFELRMKSNPSPTDSPIDEPNHLAKYHSTHFQ